MVVYACSCLNIKIFADAIKLQDVNQSSPLGSNVVEIELSDRGFDFKYGFLLKRETVKSWTVFTCLNCRKKTHSINRELKVILVNKEMECGDESLSRLAASSEFSPSFQIILSNRDSFATPDPTSQSFDTLQQQLSDISHQLNNFMLKEESLVEERIRRFEEEQREKLALVRAAALEDKKKMISLLCQQQGQELPNRGQRPRTMLTKSNSVFEGPSDRRPVAKSISVPIRSQYHNDDNMVPDIDRDELFTIDGIDECDTYHSGSDEDDELPHSNHPRHPEELYYVTGEENGEEDDDDDEVSDVVPENFSKVIGRRRGSHNSRNDSMYSASLPVNIAMTDMMRARPSEFFEAACDSSDEETGGGTPLDPEKIASNMLALSQSIPDENRYIFGDRPRPRLNTNNF